MICRVVYVIVYVISRMNNKVMLNLELDRYSRGNAFLTPYSFAQRAAIKVKGQVQARGRRESPFCVASDRMMFRRKKNNH